MDPRRELERKAHYAECRYNFWIGLAIGAVIANLFVQILACLPKE